MDTMVHNTVVHGAHDVREESTGRESRLTGATRSTTTSRPADFGSGWYHDAAIQAERAHAREAHAYPYGLAR